MITFRRLQQGKKNKRILQLWREKNAEQTAKKKRKKQVNITRMFVQQSKCPSRFRTTQRVANARIKMESETQKENVWRETHVPASLWGGNWTSKLNYLRQLVRLYGAEQQNHTSS
ncbi:hypothetical protein TNCV_3334201 [Trichonephila clavipes]|nr:hypothetical protein TNCV_3334201 [Trichonephila clavipes]